MRKILLALGLSIPATTVFCQQDSLLKKFKYRVDHYRAVGINIGATGYFNHFKPAAGTVENSTANGGFGASYYTTKSTDRILLTTSSGLSSSYNFAKNNNQNDIIKTRNLMMVPYSDILNKWFSKNNFIELGTAVSGNFANSKTTADNQLAPDKNGIAQYSVAINTGIGKGRLENITDMQNALWLIRALTETKSLSRELNTDELNELGRAITLGNNTRILDSRRRTQFILTTVDNYLQQKGLINKTDINYFTNLNDILFFAFNYPRISGTEKFIRFTPSVSGDYNNRDYSNAIDKYRDRYNSQAFLLTSGFSKNIPVSLTHQNNYGASVKLFYTHSDLLDRTFTNDVPASERRWKLDGKQAALNLFYQHGIYPSTRTAVNLNASSETGYQDIGSEKSFYGNVNLNITVNYFVSYRTRLTASLGANYQKNSYRFYQYVELLPDAVQLVANAGMEINL